MSSATILSKPHAQVLADVGCALLQVKNARGLTVEELGHELGVSRKMVSDYIAGEAEMGFTKWLRANERFPELLEQIAETTAERVLRARQRDLDLGLPSAKWDHAHEPRHTS